VRDLGWGLRSLDFSRFAFQVPVKSIMGFSQSCAVSLAVYPSRKGRQGYGTLLIDCVS